MGSAACGVHIDAFGVYIDAFGVYAPSAFVFYIGFVV
jgi:hypothetical protein